MPLCVISGLFRSVLKVLIHTLARLEIRWLCLMWPYGLAYSTLACLAGGL